jgi:tetratricopeptide (TPR) repeat protein
MWTRLNAALVNYRAGRCEQALSLLTPPDLAHPLSLPLHALLNHQLGHAPVADTSLEAAFSAAAEVAERLKSADRSDLMATTWACWWYEWAQFLNLLAEAEQAIRGETTAADELRSAAEATQVRGWTESPELAAFDQAVLFTARGPDGLLKYPWPLLARGRRLAELGRFAEAEADFNKAVELAPDDIDILQARDLFHAQRVRVEQKPPP